MVAPSFVIYRDRGHTSGSGAGGKGPSLAKTLQPSFASLGTTADYIQWLFPDNNHHGSSRLRRYRLSNISARSRDTGRSEVERHREKNDIRSNMRPVSAMSNPRTTFLLNAPPVSCSWRCTQVKTGAFATNRDACCLGNSHCTYSWVVFLPSA